MTHKPRFFYLFLLLVVLAGFSGSANSALAQNETPIKAKSDFQIPKGWVQIADKKKGYSFYAPQDSEAQVKQVEGLDILVLSIPTQASGLNLILLAYNDKTKTKEDLLDDAVSYLKSRGLKVTPGELHGESDNYAVADVTTEHPQNGIGKFRILVATDVTDNYVMLVGSPEEAFTKNEELINTIWGSFEMWSGKH